MNALELASKTIAALEAKVAEQLAELNHCHELITAQIAQINQLKVEKGNEPKPAYNRKNPVRA